MALTSLVQAGTPWIHPGVSKTNCIGVMKNVEWKTGLFVAKEQHHHQTPNRFRCVILKGRTDWHRKFSKLDWHRKFSKLDWHRNYAILDWHRKFSVPVQYSKCSFLVMIYYTGLAQKFFIYHTVLAQNEFILVLHSHRKISVPVQYTERLRDSTF